jgi:4-amino-4-deoxy-L-arabinose transferase-like glycosyltransferase
LHAEGALGIHCHWDFAGAQRVLEPTPRRLFDSPARADGLAPPTSSGLRQRAATATIRCGWIGIIVAATLVAWWARPLLSPDETRYAAVAWEMWHRQQWLVPHLNGVLYAQKPPLLFWLIHLGWWLFGVNDIWPRLLGGLAALATAALTRQLGRQLYPQRPLAADLAPWLLAGSLYWLADATMLMFDHLVSVFVLLAWLGVLRLRQYWRSGLALTALAIGGGILAKGPVVLICTGPAMLLCAPWRDSTALPRWLLTCAAASVGGLALALLWLVPALQQGGTAYAQALLWAQGAGRLVDSFAHARPWWWYLPLLPLLWLPWSLTPAFWRGLARGLRDMRSTPGLRFCVGIGVMMMLVLSSVSGKQPHYLLPLFPLWALVLAYGISLQEPPTRAWTAVPVGLLGIAAALLPQLHSGIGSWAATVSPLWGIALGLLALLAWFSGRHTIPAASLLSGTLAAACTLVLYGGVARPALERLDLSAVSRELGQQQQQREIAFVGRYRGEFTFLGRMQRPLPLLQADEIESWLRRHPDAWVVGILRTPLDPAQAATIAWQHPYRSDVVVGWTAASLARAATPQRATQLENQGSVAQ